MHAGISGKAVRYCEIFKPHAWPSKYETLCADETPVALCALDKSLLVLTTGRPRMVYGTSPEAMDDAPIEFLAACVSEPSAVSFGHGACWATSDGLAYVGKNGPPGEPGGRSSYSSSEAGAASGRSSDRSSCCGVATTTLTVTVQKRREIGILTALGSRVSQIVGVFMTQATVVALVGTVLGAYITRKIADVWFYRLVQAGLFAVSLKLIADVVL